MSRDGQANGQNSQVNRGKAPGVTKGEVKRLTADGFTPRQIARLLDISTQAVYQHLQALRRDGESAA